MLIELVMSPLWILIDTIMNFVPVESVEQVLNGAFMDLISIGVTVMGRDTFLFVWGSIVFWSVFQLGVSILKFVVNFIPTVNWN